MAKCLSVGITGIQDMGLNGDQIEALSELLEENKLPLRITGYIHDTGPTWDHVLVEDTRAFGDNQFTLAGLKLFADGALGSRGALLLDPYSDDPENRGVQITTKEQITNECIRAIKENLQVCVHAIGDSAVRLVLDAYEAAIVRTGAKDHRLRVEHSQIISPEDIPRFAELGIVPSMQPTHCTSDMYWAEARLGPERIKGAYAWHTMLKTGVQLPFGSDFPVEHPDPLAGIYAACTRQDKNGIPSSAEDIRMHFDLAPDSNIQPAMYEHGWYGNECISRLDAIRGFTSWAAFAARQERLVGTLEPDTYADFIITATDLSSCDARELLKTNIEAAYVGGVQRYELSSGQ
jgi:predicted amidohydrolase YtcJ